MSRRKRREKKESSTEKHRPHIVIEPLNEKQKDYLISLLSSPCVVCTGSAGTGKTYLAASVAARDLANRRIQRIVLSRANVSTGKSLGALPGTVQEKLEPWLMPMIDVLRKHLGSSFYDHCVKTGAIQYQPIETIRGKSFDDTVVMIDESQQLTIEELKAITTRMGERSRLYLMGDRLQRDVRTDGLGWLLNVVRNQGLPVDVHTFTSDDIVRSDLCAMFVKAFESEDSNVS